MVEPPSSANAALVFRWLDWTEIFEDRNKLQWSSGVHQWSRREEQSLEFSELEVWFKMLTARSCCTCICHPMCHKVGCFYVWSAQNSISSGFAPQVPLREHEALPQTVCSCEKGRGNDGKGGISGSGATGRAKEGARRETGRRRIFRLPPNFLVLRLELSK